MLALLGLRHLFPIYIETLVRSWSNPILPVRSLWAVVLQILLLVSLHGWHLFHKFLFENESAGRDLFIRQFYGGGELISSRVIHVPPSLGIGLQLLASTCRITRGH